MIGSVVGTALLRAATEPPLTPDAPEAREWLRRELAKQVYQQAKPTLFDRIARSVQDFFASLRVPAVHGAGPVLIVIAGIVVVTVLVLLVVVYGAPRRRLRQTSSAEVFVDDDPRTVAELRRLAARARDAGDWDAAVENAFRALTKALAERTVVSILPGTTARDVAVRIGGSFAALGDRARRSADAFDRVRYLGRHADRADAEAVAALDTDLARRPPDRLPGDPAESAARGDLVGVAARPGGRADDRTDDGADDRRGGTS